MTKAKPLTERVILEGCIPRNDGFFTLDRITEATGADPFRVEKTMQKLYYLGLIEYATGFQDARLTEMGRMRLKELQKVEGGKRL